MTEDKKKKVFPAYFSNFEMPEQATEQEIVVYRACPTHKIERDSFLNTYEENGYKVSVGFDETDPSQYSMSTCTKYKDIKRFEVIESKYKVPFLIAKGVTHPNCGVSCETRSWDTTKKRTSHVDYWLYEGAEPWREFKEVDYETK